ncbi:hypothetical protein [Paraliomyxa miuraensis]|uniref:hypothetical protein n=1 Tax=Paraliomyxa miuraensis TaxID=376150 RepID=UPI002254E465|nr:hypothetical protein [Paraliomyxa miuraensis]MCX4242205.1 DUF1566 domain-containing protein [Paraliomyxa miuraensis]
MTASRPSANRAGAALVVVCCAADDADSLRDTLASLRSDGLEVDLVEGLDQDPKQLTEVIDRRAGEGLYVLCRSPRLGRELVEELREILLSRHIPFARTLTVAVGGRGALADRIRSGLRRASTRTTGPNRPLGSEATPELVSTGRSRPLRTTNATEDEEPTLVGKLDALGSRRPTSHAAKPLPPPPALPGPPPKPPSPPSSVAAPAPEPLREESVVEAIDDDPASDEPASLSDPALSANELDLSDLDQTGSRRPSGVENTSVSLSPALITGNTVVGPAPAMITGDTLQGEKLPPQIKALAERWPPPPPSPPAPANATGNAPANAPGGPVGGPFEFEPTTAPFDRISLPPKPNPSLPTPPPPPPTTAGPLPPTAPMSAPVAPAAPSPIAPTPSIAHDVAPAGRRSMLPWALGGVAILLLALVIGLAVSGDDDPEVASAESSANDETSPPSTPAEGDPGQTKAAEESAPAGPRRYRVIDALAARKVRALDVLLIATDYGKPGDYTAAAAYCGGLEIEGLVDWRLPQIGELSSLAEASMIGRGMYWSSTASDTFGDGHMAWNVRRRHAQPYDDDAIAVCVRGGASGS